MAIYIEITKVNYKNNIYYYQVTTENFNKPKPFFIGIDPIEKKLFLYINDIAESPICKINLSDPNLEDCHYVSTRLLACILVKALDALNSNTFGEYLSYSA